ncbi:ABC transporter ATP-binding protein [Lonepinella koalarum]|uniref:ABC transporter ATP-binding protein n=1 Tax=Lonepinella koalarum TaxID=53417 RepID=UPI0011E49811|nr:ABC transporter ATP-binding protein [Lonepinella koalarum]TYG35511.1 ABC transporter ATP-binding protein [Lonepinella koalarum]
MTEQIVKEQVAIEIKNLSKHYQKENSQMTVLDNINLTINKGEFITIVGHSGCGKSTLLKMIAGMVNIDAGSIEVNQQPIEQSNEHCAMIFQESRLFPWLTVSENVGIGLKHLNKQEKYEKINTYLNLVGLKDFENAYPKALSGGMAQRAAIARGLVMNTDILLFDEPFGALDAMTKIQMQNEVLRIRQEEKKTMILVTHDIEEAVYLGDRVVVLSSRPGKIRDIVPIHIDGKKERTHDQFISYKNKIHDYFFEPHRDEIEFYI